MEQETCIRHAVMPHAYSPSGFALSSSQVYPRSLSYVPAEPARPDLFFRDSTSISV